MLLRNWKCGLKVAGEWANSGSAPVGDGRECSGIPGKFSVVLCERLVRLQASCRVSVTNLLNAKAGGMIGTHIVRPAEHSLG